MSSEQMSHEEQVRVENDINGLKQFREDLYDIIFDTEPDDQMMAIARAVNRTAENRAFLDQMSNYLKSGNSVPVERVTLKAADLSRLISLADLLN